MQEKTSEKHKAVVLFSGGLDSIIACKLLESLGFEVYAVNFSTCFFSSEKAIKAADENRINLKLLEVSREFIKVVKSPKHGHGTGINPCVDCKIFMLKKAKSYARKISAEIIATGEVLDQRPMSQHSAALKRIEEESGLKGILLRPLSGKIMPLTKAEKKGIIRREDLLGFQGRGRKKQISLAKKLGVKWFPGPAGGCILCEPEYAKKLRHIFRIHKTVNPDDAELVRYGRMFRVKDGFILVGRNINENKNLLKLRRKSDIVCEATGCGSPITILRCKNKGKHLITSAELTARYSSAHNGLVDVKCSKKTVRVKKPISFDETRMMI